MNVTGINVDITVAGGYWSSTNDPLYLGVYSKNGGREFALQVNGNSPFTNDGATVNLVLGNPCCQKEGSSFLQVDNSQNLKENDPLLNPIEINDIENVYLRKYGGQSSVTDDWGELSKVSILFCDSSGKLIRYKKEGRLHFSKESGQQHYLTKTTPPKCRVTIKLDNIHHNDMAAKPAGFDWVLNWWYIVPGAIAPASWGDSYSEKIKKKDEPDEWDRSPSSIHTFEVEGCCGIVPVIIMCISREKDLWPNADDVGSGSTSFYMDCSIPNNSTQKTVENYVNGSNNNKKSKLTYTFTITTQCLG